MVDALKIPKVLGIDTAQVGAMVMAGLIFKYEVNLFSCLASKGADYPLA